MIIGIKSLHDCPEILDNSSFFPTDDLFLYVKNLDERNYVVLIGCGEWAPDNEMYNLCLSTLKKFKQFKISKKDLKIYLTDRLINTPFSLFRINDRKGLFRPHSENLYIKEFPKSGPELTKEQQLINKLEQTKDELKSRLKK